MAVSGAGGDPARAALAARARLAAPGGTVVVVGEPDAPGGTVVVVGEPDAPGVPLLAGRPPVDGAAAAYVCRGFVCDRPVTTPDAVTIALAAPGPTR